MEFKQIAAAQKQARVWVQPFALFACIRITAVNFDEPLLANFRKHSLCEGIMRKYGAKR